MNTMGNPLFTLTLFHILITQIVCDVLQPRGKFPAILIFGDSTVDTGNNNYISTEFKANHSPYGLNFIGKKASGRFSDGRLVPDLLANALCIKELVPPFLDPKLSDHDVRTGVCFASAGSGFDDLTTAVTRVIPISEQPNMFRKYINRLNSIMGDKEARRIVNNALIVLSAGTNDFALNYYISYKRKSEYNVSAYQDFVQRRLQGILKQIHDLGGRKFGVAGLGPIGCVPAMRTVFGRGCNEGANSDARVYNDKLKLLLNKAQSALPGSEILYVDTYGAAWDMMNNPSKYGFDVVKKGCCGSGYIEAGPLCTDELKHCKDIFKYMFWDSFHPSERVYKEVAQIALTNVLSYMR